MRWNLRHHTPARSSARGRSWALALGAALCAASLLLSTPGLARTWARLPALGATALSVSGLSSGGYMAEQFAVAHSSTVQGVAVMAAGPYGCARGSVYNAMTKCSCPSEHSVMLDTLSLFPGAGCFVFSPQVMSTLSQMAIEGNAADIDPPEHLAMQRVWLLAGGQDPVVHADIVESVKAVRSALGARDDTLRHVVLPDAGHGMPTPTASQRCERTASPYLNQCQVDAAGELLKWLYQPPEGAVDTGWVRGQARAGALHQFRQTPYLRGLGHTGLDSTGWVYVPADCTAPGANCRVHVAFHGCQQGQAFRREGQARPYGQRFVKGAGYNDWAEPNRLIVLYPQVRPLDTGQPTEPYRFNPKGCWDFWGYTQRHGASLGGDDVRFPYATRSAPQIEAVWRMVQALMAPPPVPGPQP
jgi:poly(3-hydroxybutyrate) depolymerase